jgi:peptidoglycan-associated lipoprotein
MYKKYFFAFLCFCYAVLAQDLGLAYVPISSVAYLLEGMVLNEDTNEPIANANILISNKETKETINVKSDGKGKFELILQANTLYGLRATHQNFLALDEVQLQTSSHRKIYPVQLPLKEIHLSKALLVEKINFQVNDTSFTKATYPALDKFYQVLQANEQLIVEIAVHTDSRGNDEYNLNLTTQRASYIVNYLVLRGIKASRLRGIGYGEKHLVNNCANGVRCSGADHELNRRVEFVVTDFSQ